MVHSQTVRVLLDQGASSSAVIQVLFGMSIHIGGNTQTPSLRSGSTNLSGEGRRALVEIFKDLLTHGADFNAHETDFHDGISMLRHARRCQLPGGNQTSTAEIQGDYQTSTADAGLVSESTQEMATMGDVMRAVRQSTACDRYQKGKLQQSGTRLDDYRHITSSDVRLTSHLGLNQSQSSTSTSGVISPLYKTPHSSSFPPPKDSESSPMPQSLQPQRSASHAVKPPDAHLYDDPPPFPLHLVAPPPGTHPPSSKHPLKRLIKAYVGQSPFVSASGTWIPCGNVFFLGREGAWKGYSEVVGGWGG